MIPMQPYVKKWYDYLKEGKIMGLQCKRCGAWQFPPVPVCNEEGCAGTDLEWAEVSGDATLTTFTLQGLGVAPFTSDPILCGFVTLKEGPKFMSWIINHGPQDQEDLFNRMPLPAKLEIKALDENVSFPVIRIIG